MVALAARQQWVLCLEMSYRLFSRIIPLCIIITHIHKIQMAIYHFACWNLLYQQKKIQKQWFVIEMKWNGLASKYRETHIFVFFFWVKAWWLSTKTKYNEVHIIEAWRTFHFIPFHFKLMLNICNGSRTIFEWWTLPSFNKQKHKNLHWNNVCNNLTEMFFDSNKFMHFIVRRIFWQMDNSITQVSCAEY